MRTALMGILVLLWAILFEIAEINYGEGFTGTKEWDTVGWLGFSCVLVSAILLYNDWLKNRAK